MESKKIAYYPGCSLEGTSSGYAESLLKVLDVLGQPMKELEEWSCCGATSAHALDHEFHLGLNLRNLALAEQQGFQELLAPCAACYHRLVSSNNEFRNDRTVLDSINRLTGLAYRGRVRVRNLLDYLVHFVGPEKIADHVSKPLTRFRFACYYGCLNTRVPRMQSYDAVDYPNSMDVVMESLGAATVDWSYKTECCGASLSVTAEGIAEKLVTEILRDAAAKRADAIVVACPMCHVNLDTKQDRIRKRFGTTKLLPVYYITQAMGLAFGLEERQLGIRQNFVPALQI